jgi:putative transposase
MKFKVAVEAVKGERQVAEIVGGYNVHPQQVRDWKRQLLEQGSEVFSGKQDVERKHLAEERDQLYRKVGELQVKNDFLKKKLGVED